ncbi:hypothetical protein GCM10020001_064410 [Nonomuraea salmonea]
MLDDFPLDAFASWLTITGETITLTPEGLAHSDAIGPALFSPRVRALMEAYEAC